MSEQAKPEEKKPDKAKQAKKPGVPMRERLGRVAAAWFGFWNGTGGRVLQLFLAIGVSTGVYVKREQVIHALHLDHTVGQVLGDVNQKVVDLERAHQENHSLRLENENLRRWAETLRYGCHATDAATKTKEISLKISEETRARYGRVLASIPYTPPSHLLPAQLYTLGVSYFKGGETEKAAVIFHFLTHLEDNESFKTPRNFLMAGIAWYRLDHYRFADEHFDRVLKAPESSENLPFQAQSRLWKSLVAEKINQHKDSQTWLRDLIDHHPQSIESSWVNSDGKDRKGLRVPASVESVQEEGESLDEEGDSHP